MTCIEPRLPTDKHKSAIYRLALNTGPHAPAPRTGGMDDPNLDPQLLDGLTKCWLVMRQVQRFDSPTLQTQTGLQQRTVETYLGKFLRAGIVAVQRERRAGSPLGSFRTYALVQNPGPLAPVFRKDGTVFDPNTARNLNLTGVKAHV